MLTRIEIDGFKNLLGFSAEFGPFTCIAGPNAVGKSNLFDAIELLSLLADYSLEEAASRVRATSGSHESSRALFWSDGEIRSEHICIAVEMIADGWVVDELGRAARPSTPAFRYEIGLRHDGQLRLVDERLIALGQTAKSPRFPHHPSFVRAHRLDGEDRPDVVIYDAAKGIMPSKASAPNLAIAKEVVLRSYGTAEHIQILATLEELRSWRRLALNPVELRKPYVDRSANRLGPNGEHLPLLLKRLSVPGYPYIAPTDEGEEREQEESIAAKIITRMRPIASLRTIFTDDDKERETLTIRAKTSSGEVISARGLSEGTLRFLAFVILGIYSDSGFGSDNGMLYIEEPENGIHPGKFAELTQILLDLSTDVERDVTAEVSELSEFDTLSLRQVIINTQSSALVKRVYDRRKGDLLMATTALTAGPEGRDARVLRLNPLRKTWRCESGVRGVMLPIVDYVGAAVLADATASAAEES